jgi:hypothetical protein
MDTISTIKTYIDESGNSGKNLLDLEQPFFTLGAVLLDDSKLNEATKFISKIPNDLKNEQGEIKGNNIACYNQSLAIEFLSEFLPKNADMFFFSVLEKKFMIAGQIVENFFDYVYNDNTDESWTYKSEIKINLANFFYDKLSDNTIFNVHKAFLSANTIDLQNSFKEIMNEIQNVKYNFDVASIMNGAEKYLDELAYSLMETNKKNTIARGIPKNTISTPNVTTFFELINRIENYLSECNTKSKLIFDNSEQYNKVFKELLCKMVNAPRKKVALSYNECIQFGFKSLVDFVFEDSKQYVGLQIVDFLASIINHIFSKIIHKQDNELTQEDISLVSIVYLLSTKLPAGYWIVSQSTYKKIGKIISKLK